MSFSNKETEAFLQLKFKVRCSELLQYELHFRINLPWSELAFGNAHIYV